MKCFFRHLLTAFLAIAPAFAQDTIVFKNGDVLTGTILKQDAERVYFKSGSFGAVSLRTEDIAEISMETEALGKVDVPAEAIAPEPAPQQSAAAKPTPAPKPQAAAAKPKPAQPPKAPSKWSGQSGLAVALRQKTDINASGTTTDQKYKTYRVYGNLKWKGEKNNLDWKWTYRYSEDETRKRDDYFNVTQNYNHNLKYGYYAQAKTVYQRDYNRRIDNEYLQTAEIGKKWFEHPRFKFSTSVGGGYHQYERSATGVPAETTSVTEPKFILDESLRWQLINSLALFQKYAHLGNLDNYHFVFSCGLENKLVQNLFLRMEYRLDRDTDTTYDDRGFYDKALLTSVLYKF